MPAGYYRFPTIHAETVVFGCEDDLWTMPLAGGIARRLTANLGSTSTPALSPDGSVLAFTGQEEGHAEVYCMPAVGGPAQRLTYLGAGTQVVGWQPDGQSIIFASNSGQPFHDIYYLYRLPTSDGQAERLPTGVAMSISYGPQGGRVISRNTTDLAHWKRYRGGQTGDLWIDPDGSDDWRRLIQLAGNLAVPLWVGERIYFISDHEGIGNLYSCLPIGADLQRHTAHDEYYVRHPATDGRRIVYHAGADLYYFDPASGENRRIEVEFHSPRVQRNRKFVESRRYLQSYDLHPNGHSVAVTTRGKPFVMANWEEAVIQHGQLQGVHYRLAVWLYDGKRLALISDASGEERLEIHHGNAGTEPERLEDLDLGRVMAIAASPKKAHLALSNHRHGLVLVDIESRTSRVLDHSRYSRIRGLAWSPDGRWLAYGFANTDQTSIIKLCLIESGQTWEVTRPVLHDVGPAFDPDGNYLYFLSYREFDPIFDNLQFDLNFPYGMRPYLVTLRADLPSPFAPVPRPPGEKIQSSDNSKKNGPKNGNANDQPSQAEPSQKDEASQPAEPPPGESKPEAALQIDLEGIADRIIALPVTDGRYGQIRGIKGKILFSSYPLVSALDRNLFSDSAPAANGKIEVYNLETQSHDVLLRGITDFDLSLDYRTLIYRAGNDLRVLKAGEKPEENSSATRRQTGWLDLDRIKVLVEPQAEWEQMYREAWRLQRDYFWSEDMSGIDWQTVYRRYLPLVERVATRAEFSDLLWEMQGELGTSHAYEFGGDYRPEPKYRQGFLGADFDYDAATDSYRVTAIAQGDVWARREGSPLARAGVNVRVGDRLIAVNRRPVSQAVSPQELLVNQAGEAVLLTFVRGDESEPRHITVETLYSERAVRYRDWVEANRRRVHEATDSRVGYVHIPDMTASGYAEFHRSYLAEVGREGLIVDVRFNRGGFVSPLILEKLTRRRIGYQVPRWGEPDAYPRESVLGPIVALTNERSGSDGDIFSHSFKLMKLGPLIGTRTWGGVIGITLTGSLVDGGVTTQPQFSFWFSDVGWSVENHGTEPDIEVEIRPQDYVAGHDPQLERTIAEIQRLLSETPPRLPDFGERPRLHLPALPETKPEEAT